eukprot:3120658-Prymnesium_polylepis.1
MLAQGCTPDASHEPVAYYSAGLHWDRHDPSQSTRCDATRTVRSCSAATESSDKQPPFVKLLRAPRPLMPRTQQSSQHDNRRYAKHRTMQPTSLSRPSHPLSDTPTARLCRAAAPGGQPSSSERWR